MALDGTSTGATTGVPMPSTTTKSTTSTTGTTTKDAIKSLKSLQSKIWALIGLKAAVDRLETLGYKVVVRQENGRTTISLELNVDFDMKTGLVNGKDLVVVQDALDAQIKALEEK